MITTPLSPPKHGLFRSILISIGIHLVGAAVVWGCLFLFGRFTGFDLEMNHEDCTAVHIYFFEVLVFGMAIGVIGALFQALDMRHWFGSVRRSTVLRLCLLWGLLLGFIGLSLVRFSDVDSGVWSYCLKNTIYSGVFSVIATYTFIFVVPVPILLIIAGIMTFRIWRDERWWHQLNTA